MDHCQHALIGKFRQDLPGKQVYYISQQDKKEEAEFRFSAISLFTKDGQLLWSDDRNIWFVGGMVVENWTGNPKKNFVALYSRGFAPPALFDGSGREIATFPFPPAIRQTGGGPEGKDLAERGRGRNPELPLPTQECAERGVFT